MSRIIKHNKAFDRSVKKARNKPIVLKSRREKLLCSMIVREVRRVRVVSYSDKLIHSSEDVFGRFLERGYLYFSDFGISGDSQFMFIELGVITPCLYRELKAIPAKLSDLLQEGDHRRDEYQARLYYRMI